MNFNVNLFTHSSLLSQVFGLYLLIMAIIMLSRQSFYRELIMNINPKGPGAFISAAWGLLLGLLMVLMHNVWVMEPRVLVTLLGWVILFKSVMWLSMPDCMASMAKKVYAGNGFYVAVIVMAVLGMMLLSNSFKAVALITVN